MELKKAVSIMVGAGVLAASGFAQAQSSSPVYYRVDTGYSWATDMNMQDQAFQGNICGPGCASPGQLDKAGNAWIASLGVGYKFSREFRGDVVAGYRSGYSIGEYDQNNSYFSSSSMSSWSLLANGYFDIPLGSRVTAYVGAGAGMAWNNTDGLVNVSTGFVSPGTDKYNFAWNGMVGISIPVSAGVAVDVGYRYIDLGDVQTGATAGYGGATGKLRANELQFGLRF